MRTNTVRGPTTLAALLLLATLAVCPAFGLFEDEVPFLLAQRNAITNWDAFSAANNFAGWDPSTPLCSWTGVACNITSGVFAVYFGCETTNNNFPTTCNLKAEGRLAPELASAQSLIAVEFINQSISGILPLGWSTVGAFNRLEYLSLNGNQLTGALPNSFGQPGSFSKLKFLFLRNNSFTGTLPSSWAGPNAFPSLSLADLSLNKLEGALPKSWGSSSAFRNLEALDLAGNMLTGSLPASWGEQGAFDKLAFMGLQDNTGISGPIPTSWGNSSSFPQLTYLTVNGTSICGDASPIIASAVCEPVVPYFMLDEKLLQDNLTYDCANGKLYLRTCPPSPPAPWLPPPPVGSPPPVAASASAIGPIIGGVVGGLAVLAVLAFFAFRTGKGWLRSKPVKGVQLGGSLPAPAILDSYLSQRTSDAGSKLTKYSTDDGLGLPPLDEVLCSQGPMGPMPPQGNAWRTPTSPGPVASNPTDSRSTATANSFSSDPLLSHIASVRGRQRSMRSEPGSRLSNRSLAATDASLPLTNKSSGQLSGEVQQWEVLWDELQLRRQIGRGSFGWVYLAQWQQTPVAAKLLVSLADIEAGLALPEKIMRELQEEAAVLARMRHPNIVSFMGLCASPPCIVTEYCSQGSLYELLRRPEAQAHLTWQRRLGMASDAARGLLYLQSRGIVHRDVKSPNMLVDAAWRVKVSDFNLSKIRESTQTGSNSASTSGGPNNPIWLAPEVMEGKRAGPAADVYSFGLVLYELLTWKLPWRGASPFVIAKQVTRGDRPGVPLLEELPGPTRPDPASYEAFCDLMRYSLPVVNH